MENWYWIELIGFDNTQEDYGVKHFVENVPQIKGVSLLFSNIDFVNCHTDSVTEQELLPCDCSYGGHKYSEERERQVWTNFQLKGLIGSLHSYGIKVLFSFFNIFTFRTIISF